MCSIGMFSQTLFIEAKKRFSSVLVLLLLMLITTASFAEKGNAEIGRNHENLFASDAGPIVTVQGGDKDFAIPKGYFEMRQPGYASKESWQLEVLWPGLMPWRENNADDDRNFHAPGGGRQIAISIYFGGKHMATFLNRLIQEDDGPGIGYRPGLDVDFPDDTLAKRKKGKKKYGLHPYYVDFARVINYLNQHGRNISFEKMDVFDKGRWSDWYIRRNSKDRVTTLIQCDTMEVPDPPEMEVTGKKLIMVPHCNHKFLLEPIDAYAELNYRRIYLHDWEKIERTVRELISKFQIAATKR